MIEEWSCSYIKTLSYIRKEKEVLTLERLYKSFILFSTAFYIGSSSAEVQKRDGACSKTPDTTFMDFNEFDMAAKDF